MHPPLQAQLADKPIHDWQDLEMHTNYSPIRKDLELCIDVLNRLVKASKGCQSTLKRLCKQERARTTLLAS